MKKLLFIVIALVLLLAPTLVSAEPSDSIYIEWVGGRSANFYPTASGIVHAWSVYHPSQPDTHWVIKPTGKFPNAIACDEPYVIQRINWTPDNIQTVENTDELHQVFGEDLTNTYLLCKYEIFD